MVQQFFRLLRLCHRAAPLYSPDYLRVLLRAFRLCYRQGYLPKEAFQLGLLNPELPDDELSKYASVKRQTEVLQSINPSSWESLVRDKGIFYLYCMALGAPIAKLYAIFFRKTPGWSYNGSPLKSRDDWKNFFDTQLPSEFVIKPAQGFLGRAVNIFSKTPDGFVDASGKSYKAEQIYHAISSDTKFDSFIVQQRLKNHPDLLRLTDTDALQTLRIDTFVDSDGKCRILHAHQKLITGRSITDNFERGLTGNLQADVSLDDGTLAPAVTMDANGLGIKTVPIHPGTDRTIEGFQLPWWTQACRLVTETASHFLPIWTIGWDIALTPDGPLISEANIWWAAHNQHQCAGAILDVLSGNAQ